MSDPATIIYTRRGPMSTAFYQEEDPKNKAGYTGQSGVSICKRFFDQIVIIKECWDINSKTLTVFLFLNFIHLPFFLNPHLAPNLYIVVQLVLHLDY